MQTTTDQLTTTARINAPIDRVWKAVTTPALIKQWFFGVDTTSDWKVGSPLVHRGEYQGKPYVDKGEILRIEPPRLLEHTHWSDVSGKPDRPEDYQTVTWQLTEGDGATELRITEQNLPSREAAETSEQAWNQALGKLKELLETERRLEVQEATRCHRNSTLPLSATRSSGCTSTSRRVSAGVVGR